MEDLGSIRQTGANARNVKEYILNSADAEKLSKIDNAADGSTAFCVDTSELYILHMHEWVKIGE